MSVLCFLFLFVKLIYEAYRVAYVEWCVENRNPYRAYREAVNAAAENGR